MEVLNRVKSLLWIWKVEAVNFHKLLHHLQQQHLNFTDSFKLYNIFPRKNLIFALFNIFEGTFFFDLIFFIFIYVQTNIKAHLSAIVRPFFLSFVCTFSWYVSNLLITIALKTLQNELKFSGLFRLSIVLVVVCCQQAEKRQQINR